MTTPTRPLIMDGPCTSAIGLGTWALGGPAAAGTQPIGWGRRWNRDQAAAVIRAAFDHGITLFDTADAYGAGTAELLLGEVLGPVRDEVHLVSKWGNLIDDERRQLTGTDGSPEHLRRALDASLTRLGTDRIDLYLFHLSGHPLAQAVELLGTLQDLVGVGKIGAYGWSSDDPERVGAWIGEPGFGAVEINANVVDDPRDLIDLIDGNRVPALARGPLATGLLTGKYRAGIPIGDQDDFRRISPDWLVYFTDGIPNDYFLQRIDVVADVLRADGRTLAQGALCWLLARSPNLIPIPGAKTIEQVVGNAAALTLGPLPQDQMDEIDRLLDPEFHTWWAHGCLHGRQASQSGGMP